MELIAQGGTLPMRERINRLLRPFGVALMDVPVDTHTTLDTLQKLVDKQVGERGGYWSPQGIFLKLTEELGELARLLNTECPRKESDATTSANKEIADVLYALICLANRHGIDLEKALREKLGVFEVRDKKRFPSGGATHGATGR